MNVAVTVNDTYVYPLSIMLQTLFRRHRNIQIHVWLLYGSMSTQNREFLRAICERNHNRWTEIRVGEDTFADAPSRLYFSREMYFRLLLPFLLPETEERVLYLDPDLLVCDSLSEFYHTNLEGYCMAGCRDRLQDKDNPEYRKLLGLKEETRYINSGVLLLHLKELRRCLKPDQIYRIIEERGEELLFPDQDLINLLFEGRMKCMDDRYNINPNHLFAVEVFRYGLGISRPAILHYMGPIKPWRRGYSGQLYQYYWINELRYTNRPRAVLLWRAPRVILSHFQGYLNLAKMFFRRIRLKEKRFQPH